jgi:aryl-alcohol dehydrogenase-like predicted oxidoreductase
VIGLGTWVFGGRWGGADDVESLAACHASIDAGVNWNDTADIYGQRRAERIVVQLLRDRRDEVLIATKCGVAWTMEPSFRIWREASADYIRRAVDRNLEALGIDVIDLYQIHWPVAGVPAEETMGALRELHTAGKIRAIGVSNYHLTDPEAAHAANPVDSFQSATT